MEISLKPLSRFRGPLLKNQLLKQAEDVFVTTAERRAVESGPSVKDLQAKVGQLTMENDFLEGALGRIHVPSAKR